MLWLERGRLVEVLLVEVFLGQLAAVCPGWLHLKHVSVVVPVAALPRDLASPFWGGDLVWRLLPP